MNCQLMKINVGCRSCKSQHFSEMSFRDSPMSKKYLRDITYTISERLK